MGFVPCCKDVEDAIQSGHGRCLDYYGENHQRWMDDDFDIDLCTLAAEYGQVDCLEHIMETQLGCIWHNVNNAQYAALRNNHLDILEFFYANGYPFENDFMTSAVSYGNLETVKFLHKRRIYWDTETMCEAVFHGFFDIVTYLFENDCPYDDDELCATATHSGTSTCNSDSQLHILMYLHDNGCQLNERCYFLPTKYGNMEMLKFLVSRKCPFGTQIAKQLARVENVNSFRYLVENGCPYGMIEPSNKVWKLLWFQKHSYCEKGIVNPFTLHVKHKIQRMQRAWVRHAYNPTSLIGHARMIDNVTKIRGIVNMHLSRS